PPAVWLPVPRPSSVAPSRHSPPPRTKTLVAPIRMDPRQHLPARPRGRLRTLTPPEAAPTAADTWERAARRRSERVKSKSLGRDQPERDALVDTRLARKPQHPFTNGVALDLVGAAADAVGQVGEEVEAPATVEGAGRAEQFKGELAGAVDMITDGQLDDRA